MKRSSTLLGFALALCTAAPSSAQTPAAWDQPVNVAAADGTLTKTNGCNYCPDAGAHSRTQLTGDGYAEFTAVAGHLVTAGLGADLSSSTSPLSIDFAVTLWPSGAFEIRERGVYRTDGAFADGDRFRIAIESGIVVYRRNGAVLRTSATPPAFPLAFDVTLSTSGAILRDATVVVPTAAAAWESPVRVTATPGQLVKAGGCDGCQDAGAHSVARLTGDGYAEFVPQAGVITAGLSTDTSAATTMMNMNYAFTVRPGGAWEVREMGVYKTEGSGAAGDRFRVAVESGKVVYRRNGVKVYASAVVPSAALVMDVTLSSRDAVITAAAIEGGGGIAVAAPTPPAPAPPPPPAPPASGPAIVTRGPYSAVVDRQTYLEPPLPALGRAGTTIADPVFASTIGRITDSFTRPGLPNRSYRTPSSPHQNAWSAKGNYFYVTSGDGSILPYRFDAATATAQRLNPTITGEGGLVLRFYIEPQFSHVEDSLIYGSVSGMAGATLRTIDQYDINTGNYSRLLDLDAIVAGLSGTYIGGVASSGGSVERVMAFFGGTSQDKHHYVVVFDKNNPERRVLLDSTAVLNMRLHHAAMDRSGRYVMLYSTWADQSSTRKAAQSYLWDTETGSLTELNTAALPYGHDAFGYGVSVNQDCCTASAWDAAQWQFRTLSTPLVTRDVIRDVVSPKEVYLADHATWNNARADQLVPFITGMFRAPSSASPWRAWDDEIIAVQTDTAPGAEATVWRFAHHRSDVRSDNDPAAISFWYEPRPNVSPDGRWALFTSNWEKSLGTDPTADAATRARQDVFVVNLK